MRARARPRRADAPAGGFCDRHTIWLGRPGGAPQGTLAWFEATSINAARRPGSPASWRSAAAILTSAVPDRPQWLARQIYGLMIGARASKDDPRSAVGFFLNDPLQPSRRALETSANAELRATPSAIAAAEMSGRAEARQPPLPHRRVGGLSGSARGGDGVSRCASNWQLDDAARTRRRDAKAHRDQRALPRQRGRASCCADPLGSLRCTRRADRGRLAVAPVPGSTDGGLRWWAGILAGEKPA